MNHRCFRWSCIWDFGWFLVRPGDQMLWDSLTSSQRLQYCLWNSKKTKTRKKKKEKKEPWSLVSCLFILRLRTSYKTTKKYFFHWTSSRFYLGLHNLHHWTIFSYAVLLYLPSILSYIQCQGDKKKGSFCPKFIC